MILRQTKFEWRRKGRKFMRDTKLVYSVVVHAVLIRCKMIFGRMKTTKHWKHSCKKSMRASLFSHAQRFKPFWLIFRRSYVFFFSVLIMHMCRAKFYARQKTQNQCNISLSCMFSLHMCERKCVNTLMNYKMFIAFFCLTLA